MYALSVLARERRTQASITADRKLSKVDDLFINAIPDLEQLGY